MFFSCWFDCNYSYLLASNPTKNGDVLWHFSCRFKYELAIAGQSNVVFTFPAKPELSVKELSKIRQAFNSKIIPLYPIVSFALSKQKATKESVRNLLK